MDTANLIEEAERWAKNVSESPGNGTAGEDLYGAKLLCDLAAALKASEERARKAEKTQEQLYDEWREELRVSERERDAIAAANLAANKRIVELEQERDEWMRRAQGWESEAKIASERFNRLADAQPGEPLDMDCGDSSCAFAKTRGGMRTNGGCRCLENLGFYRGQTDSLRRMAAEIVYLRKRLLDLMTPRPIAEAPRDGTWILGCWPESNEWLPIVMHWTGKEWQREDPAERDEGYLPTHYLPMPEVKP